MSGADEDDAVDTAERELSDDEVRDELPDDLNAAGYVGPYVFPNNNRRRIPGFIYLGLAALCGLAYAGTRDSDPVLVNEGTLIAGAGLALFGIAALVGYRRRRASSAS